MYLAQDRPDLDVVACEMAKTIANPRVGDEALIKKVCRYLRGPPTTTSYTGTRTRRT